MKLDLNPELTPEQAFFHGTTRQFLDDKVPTSLVRELRSDPAGFGRDFWRQGADLGWTSLLVTEADGGGRARSGTAQQGWEAAVGFYANVNIWKCGAAGRAGEPGLGVQWKLTGGLNGEQSPGGRLSEGSQGTNHGPFG
jgi:alkylation response protein AidB-like acyl-CoA dehydrogenase